MSEVSTENTASGVKELIEKIRHEGVASAEKEAASILHDAKREAASIIASAKSDSAQMLEEARQTIETEKHATEEAIKLAARDTIKELGEGVSRAFDRQLQRFIHKELADETLLRELVIAIGGQASESVAQHDAVEVLLHYEEGDEVAEKRIHDLIFHLSQESFREGMTLRPEACGQNGVTINIVGDDLRVEITEETLTELLTHQLLPRYRSILRSTNPDFTK
ncbi:hypothetical protein ACFSW8_02125 [Rubritalea tangerina]|uniref:V-type ATP synthase subunit E n=2 Tax=Rubritalea tangerina TaxID=430798 RepID=A0ABW4Z6Z4_9BACT